MQEDKKVLVSGVQSSGRLHIGNYFGALKQNIDLANSGDFESYIFIADYHSMTTQKDGAQRREDMLDAACVYLACGLDVSRVALFKQSDVPSHTELSWILSTMTPMPMLELAHAYKDKKNISIIKNGVNLHNQGLLKEITSLFLEVSEMDNEYNSFFVWLGGNIVAIISNIKNKINVDIELINDEIIYKPSEGSVLYISKIGSMEPLGSLSVDLSLKGLEYREIVKNNIDINAGLFTYPVLMAADILMYNADTVPVGKDQAQHVEMTREIAGKYNRAYGETFKMPIAYIKKEGELVPGIDGNKMSKSKNNHIPIFGNESEITKLVMSIVTDSKKPEEAKDPDTNNVYNIHKLFLNEKEDAELRARYTEAEEARPFGYAEAKKLCAEAVISYFSDMRIKYEYYKNNIGEVKEVLNSGAEKANIKAKIMMEKVRIDTGLDL